MPGFLRAFAVESNRIEGITSGADDNAHADALAAFLWESPTVESVERFVARIEPRAVLRRAGAPNVRVGHHHAPKSGPEIERALAALLEAVRDERVSPFDAHYQYEKLHPFTDGNGRSGRAIWLWQMRRMGYDGGRLFLHQWYYDSLSNARI